MSEELDNEIRWRVLVNNALLARAEQKSFPQKKKLGLEEQEDDSNLCIECSENEATHIVQQLCETCYKKLTR